MKLIAAAAGIAAARVSRDAVIPEKGVLQRDIVSHLAERYQFNISPHVGPDAPPSPVLVFQSGILDPAGKRIPIMQSLIFPDGCAAIAKDTDLADAILEDLMEEFDNTFGYHYGHATIQNFHLSNIVVQFDATFTERTKAFHIIQKFVNDSIAKDGHNYYLKHLSFGIDSEILPRGLPSTDIDKFISQDFIIERRAKEPLEKNLFFCSAPMRTKEHVALLENLERAVVGEKEI